MFGACTGGVDAFVRVKVVLSGLVNTMESVVKADRSMPQPKQNWIPNSLAFVARPSVLRRYYHGICCTWPGTATADTGGAPTRTALVVAALATAPTALTPGAVMLIDCGSGAG